MFRVLQSVIVFSILALAGVFVFAGPAAAEEAVPIEPLHRLPEEEGGIGSPAVSLRPDGGMIAVWGDLAAGEIVGSWFQPVDQAVGPSSGDFVLAPTGGGSTRLAMARGAGDRYLAVWQSGGPDYPLSARAFDGTGMPLGPVRSVASSSFLSPALAARPGGGYVVAYWEPAGESFSLRYRVLAEDGSPLGAVEVDALPEDWVPSDVNVAVDPEGAFTIAWSFRTESPRELILAARTFSSIGVSIGPPFEVARLDDESFFVQHAIAAVGAGELLAAWVERQSHDAGILWVRHFHPDGSLSPSRRVDIPNDPDRHQVTNPALVGTADGSAVVAWSESEATTPTRLLARLLEADGSARGLPFEVATVPEDLHFFNDIAIDRDETGLLAFGWGAGFDPGVLPTGYEFYFTAYARRFQEVEAICPPVYTVDLRTEPAAPTEDDDIRLILEGVAECAERFRGDWSFDPALGGFRVVGSHSVGECASDTLGPFSLPFEAGRLAAGEYPVAFQMLLPDDGVCERQLDFTVAPGEPTGPPPVPDAPPLVSDELPGFRTWVVITADGESVLGSQESACIAETLCVSGRVPGRSEVFVRVVGPKPNGRLWPTLVKFTTSTVEVWIEQVSTGEVEYYRLEGASPDVDELPGLFDREGFLP